MHSFLKLDYKVTYISKTISCPSAYITLYLDRNRTDGMKRNANVFANKIHIHGIRQILQLSF